MKIDISSIRGANGASLSVAVPLILEDVSEEGHVARFKGPVRVSGNLTNTGSCFVLTGEAHAAVEVLCDRCMEPFELTVEAEMQCGYVDVAQRQGGSRRSFGDVDSQDDPNADPDLRYFSGDEIEVTEEVREAVLLSLPGKRLCSTECKGICPECGVNRNRSQCDCSEDSVDPRLAGLSRLLRD